MHVLTALFACYKTETAAVPAHVLCTPYAHAPAYSFVGSHIRSGVHARLAVTCHLLFWQNDRNLFRATERERRGGTKKEMNQHRKLTLEKKRKKKSSAAAAGTRTRYLSSNSPHSTAEVFPPSTRSLCIANIMDGKRWQLLQQAGIYFGL